MKKILLVLVFCIAISLPSLASEYISAYDLAVVGDKAYLIEIEDSKTYLNQYSFPGLALANQLLLGDDFSYAYANTEGVVVTTYTYDIPTETLVAEDGGSSTKAYKETRTIQTYNLALTPIAAKTSEYEYYYTFDNVEDESVTASGKASAVDSAKCSGKKRKGKSKACNKVLL